MVTAAGVAVAVAGVDAAVAAAVVEAAVRAVGVEVVLATAPGCNVCLEGTG